MLTLQQFNNLSKNEQNQLIVDCINNMSVQSGSGLLDNFRADSFSPAVMEIKNKYGNDTITKMTIVRTPLSKFLDIAMNALSLGDFNKAKNNNSYDDFFHLHLNLTTSSGAKLTLEKTEVVSIQNVHTISPNSESMEILEVPPNITLNQLLDYTQKLMGKRFFTYSASSNNCQYFIRDILLAMGIQNQNYHAFVKQNTESIFKNNTFLRKVSNSVTDIASSANNVVGKINSGISHTTHSISKSAKKTGKEIKKLFGGSTYVGLDKMKKKELANLVKMNKKLFNRKINITGMKKAELLKLLQELD